MVGGPNQKTPPVDTDHLSTSQEALKSLTQLSKVSGVSGNAWHTNLGRFKQTQWGGPLLSR